MKISFLFFLMNVVVHAAPIGICLHAFSADAPNEKIGSIAFDKLEKDQQGTRVFPTWIH